MKVAKLKIAKPASLSEHMARRDAAEQAAKLQHPHAESVRLYALLGDGSYLAEVRDKGATFGRPVLVAE